MTFIVCLRVGARRVHLSDAASVSVSHERSTCRCENAPKTPRKNQNAFLISDDSWIFFFFDFFLNFSINKRCITLVFLNFFLKPASDPAGNQCGSLIFG